MFVRVGRYRVDPIKDRDKFVNWLERNANETLLSRKGWFMKDRRAGTSYYKSGCHSFNRTSNSSSVLTVCSKAIVNRRLEEPHPMRHYKMPDPEQTIWVTHFSDSPLIQCCLMVWLRDSDQGSYLALFLSTERIEVQPANAATGQFT